MTKMDWKARAKNKTFWVALLAALLILVQAIMTAFGVQVDLDSIGGKMTAIINAVFAILSVLGVVVDPTTDGITDGK